MRTVAVALISLLLLPLVSSGETFYLKEDGSDQLHGPYEIKDNGKMVIGDRTYTVVTPSAPAALPGPQPTLRQKLTETIIPKIDIRQAHVNDVFEFLRQASTEYSPYKHAQPPGVNIVVVASQEELGQIAPLTFTAQGLSLLEALKGICSVAGLQYELKEQWIMITKKP